MKFKALHLKTDFEGTSQGEESVVIIDISQTDPKLAPQAVFVREDGTISSDSIGSFIITDGAW